MALTAKQRRLRREIEEIATAIEMDHWNIEQYDEDARTVMLELMRNQLVRGEIVMHYALIDEFLTVIVCHFFFRSPGRNRSFRELWRTKRFRIFNHQIMDETYMLAKMRIAHAIADIPGEVQTSIQRINAVRNDIAHSFFPENRKAHMPKKKRLYQGEDIFTKNGIEKFEQDFVVARNYLMQRAFGISWD